MLAENSVIITIGILVNADRCAIVFPLSSDTAVDPITGCGDAVSGVVSDIIPLLQQCMASDSYIQYVQAEGAVDGMTPQRSDFSSGLYPGLVSGVSAPSSVGGMMGFYEDPADKPTPTSRTRLGKNTIPGVSVSELTGDLISLAIQGALLALGNDLLNGFTGGSNRWYRVVKIVSRTIGAGVIRAADNIARGYVVTQRRRMVPRN